MKCELCNEDVYVFYQSLVPEGLMLTLSENGKPNHDSRCIHLDCVLDMQNQLAQLMDFCGGKEVVSIVVKIKQLDAEIAATQDKLNKTINEQNR